MPVCLLCLEHQNGSVITPGSSAPPADCSTFRVDTAVIKQRVPILLKYLDSDTEKELQALYALQASIVKLDQPASKFPSWFPNWGELEALKDDLELRHGIRLGRQRPLDLLNSRLAWSTE